MEPKEIIPVLKKDIDNMLQLVDNYYEKELVG
jgi:hypothetical protein